MDKAHLIPKQVIKRECGKDSPAVWDPRVWVLGCRNHHHLFDARRFLVLRSDLPPVLTEYSHEYGLHWRVERDYPLEVP